MSTKILMIAYHFPPLLGSSGILRTLKFSRYLPENGWLPVVLTTHPRAYPKSSAGQLAEIPNEVVISRAFALDTTKHLSVWGKYPEWLALPDRWSSWWLGALWTGWRLIKKHRPAVIWSTYPIATAHLIGLTLHRLSGVPWVADFRDPMYDDSIVKSPLNFKITAWIEKKTIEYCSKAVFTTRSTLDLYAQRYPHEPQSKWQVIENGFDEENFIKAERNQHLSKASSKITLLHSGILYSAHRDPSHFFLALAELKKDKEITANNFTVILRASGEEDLYTQKIVQAGLTDIVQLAPAVDYQQAIGEMLQTDALLVFQDATCNHQIPAKLYEYLRAKRPILALTDKNSDTAKLLYEAGLNYISPIDDVAAIKTMLLDFLHAHKQQRAAIPYEEVVAQHSRKAKTHSLALLLNTVKL